MGRHGEKRDAISVITGTRYGGPVAGRDPGPWAFSWLAGGAAAVLSFGVLLPGGSWWPPLAVLAGMPRASRPGLRADPPRRVGGPP
jgi:hypothetical protein